MDNSILRDKFPNAKEPTYFQSQIYQALFGYATRHNRNVIGTYNQYKFYKDNYLNPSINGRNIR